jgi:hypothetical protein
MAARKTTKAQKSAARSLAVAYAAYFEAKAKHHDGGIVTWGPILKEAAGTLGLDGEDLHILTDLEDQIDAARRRWWAAPIRVDG